LSPPVERIPLDSKPNVTLGAIFAPILILLLGGGREERG